MFGSSFWPDVGLGGMSLVRRVAEAICSQVRKEQQKGCSATSRCEITINNT
ncbi:MULTISPECIES: hypothetical protein [Sinorhizobium]|uniref:hypothetical protein n=1 Tax=Sinorhizobium TaxID=28105 RepID=UPI001304D41E|nr:MULTISPECIES: hypothetical protein [Sinorhizobium]